MLSPADIITLPFDDWINAFVRGWLVPNFRSIPMVLRTGALGPMSGGEWRSSPSLALPIINMIGLWNQTMTSLAMVVTSVAFCALIGIPAGILAAGSDRAWRVMRPILDIMQTIPSFVYLVPIVMLFGVGMAPGIIATIVFALPPMVRLTNLGIRNARGDLIEAAEAFGATRWQMLRDLQLPLAMRTIMAGLNQTLMLSLSMVVIAALIGGGGLGLVVNTGLGRLDVGGATAGGVGIVILAIVLDRITQGLADGKGTPSLGKTLASFFSLRKAKAPEEALAEKAA